MCIVGIFGAVHAEHAAKITMIEGKASILRSGGADWIAARPNMPLNAGDQMYTREESFAEIVYATGAITRLNEKTKITIVAASENGVKTSSGVGDVWVNMRKLVTKAGRDFELSTPTATAAIRGTVFHTQTHADSSTDIAVYEGTVAVGPGEQAKKNVEEPKQPRSLEPQEVQGPEEVPGPYEVSLEEWKNIVAGQRISVRRDGKFAQERFDTQKAAQADAFVKKNLELDAKAGK